MNWSLSKRNAAANRKPSNVIMASIREKLTDYQPSAERSVFVGPAFNHPDDHFEFEKVEIDPDSSGFHHVPFSC